VSVDLSQGDPAGANLDEGHGFVTVIGDGANQHERSHRGDEPRSVNA